MPHTRIALCPDTGHVVLGGGDPYEVTRKYVDRLKYYHLKDVTDDGIFCPLGYGVIDFKPILELLKSERPDLLYAIECDGWYGDPLEAAKITYTYLKENFAF
jgi:inosose dehydratase